MRRFVVLVSAIAVVAVVPAASPARETAARPPAQRAALASGIVTQLNAIRASHQLAPLVLDAKLTAAATAHSSEMLAKGYFAHESADGTAADKRIKKYYRKAVVGENLLWFLGNMAAADVVGAWMNNPPHRDVILDSRWRAIGIGALYSQKAPGHYRNRPTTVITADFGA